MKDSLLCCVCVHACMFIRRSLSPYESFLTTLGCVYLLSVVPVMYWYFCSNYLMFPCLKGAFLGSSWGYVRSNDVRHLVVNVTNTASVCLSVISLFLCVWTDMDISGNFLFELFVWKNIWHQAITSVNLKWLLLLQFFFNIPTMQFFKSMNLTPTFLWRRKQRHSKLFTRCTLPLLYETSLQQHPTFGSHVQSTNISISEKNLKRDLGFLVFFSWTFSYINFWLWFLVRKYESSENTGGILINHLTVTCQI